MHAETGSGQCGFNARMTRADDGNVTGSCMIGHRNPSNGVVYSCLHQSCTMARQERLISLLNSLFHLRLQKRRI